MTRLARLHGYVVLAIFVAMTTAAHLEDLRRHGDANGPFDDPSYPGLEAARGARREKSADGYRKRQSFSVTQDLDALAEMLREASMRRRLQNAIAFFNALKRKKKRDVQGAYGGVLPVPENPIKNEE